ncbi:shikimate kinase [Waterburya agarophytonicola K14]|uniref:Shikimate kinase n=2 Tax=Waterburya TaxID=2886915 RepID=A0A964BPC5_9CYAN|nr:shikimate kinase [Waterburya agarophytonicola KI4]
MMGAGKTTVGKQLAKDLNYRFIDTDETIEAIAKQPITDIFQTEGEVYFRELETQVLSQLSVYARSVISTGGGIITKQTNWSYLRDGLVVWLDVDLEILKKRLAQDQTRPLADKLESLLETRRSLYAQADIVTPINSDISPADISAKIIETIPTVLKSQVKIPNN